jgi:uncharacterized protein DUF4382
VKTEIAIARKVNIMKRMRQLKLTPAYVLAFTVLVVAGLVAACGGSPTSPSGNATLRLMLTDAPIEGLEKVNIYFTTVTVKPADKPSETLTLQLQENPVDLLTLDDKVIGFAAGAVTPGDFEFIHINIDKSKSFIVVKGVQKSLQVPSEEIKILGGFAVDENHATTLTLDFDAQASIVTLGNGEFLLKPVIVKTASNTSSQP